MEHVCIPSVSPFGGPLKLRKTVPVCKISQHGRVDSAAEQNCNASLILARPTFKNQHTDPRPRGERTHARECFVLEALHFCRGDKSGHLRRSQDVLVYALDLLQVGLLREEHGLLVLVRPDDFDGVNKSKGTCKRRTYKEFRVFIVLSSGRQQTVLKVLHLEEGCPFFQRHIR